MLEAIVKVPTAPEKSAGFEGNAATLIFSFGVTIFFLIST